MLYTVRLTVVNVCSVSESSRKLLQVGKHNRDHANVAFLISVAWYSGLVAWHIHRCRHLGGGEGFSGLIKPIPPKM